MPSTEAFDKNMTLEKRAKNDVMNFGEEESKLDTKRPPKDNAFSLKVQSLEIQDNFDQNLDESQTRTKTHPLANSVSLELELQPQLESKMDFSEEPLSPTKGAPKFFKNLINDKKAPQFEESPTNKLKLNWSSVLKIIGRSLVKDLKKDSGPSEPTEASGQVLSKESEDAPNKIDHLEFEYLEDVERLTATDPGEYFKCNPTLLSKLNMISIDDFEYVRTLGAGAYGQVFLVRKKASGDYYAMKIIATDKELSPKYVKNLLNEREVFSVIKSEFCVNALATFIYKSLVCFVMEYLPGRDLYEEVFERENLWFSSSTIKNYLAELVLGI